MQLRYHINIIKVSDETNDATGCNGNCTDSPRLLQQIKDARTKFFEHPQLMVSIKQAGTETSNAAGPMTAQAFLAYDGGPGASAVSTSLGDRSASCPRKPRHSSWRLRPRRLWPGRARPCAATALRAASRLRDGRRGNRRAWPGLTAAAP